MNRRSVLLAVAAVALIAVSATVTSFVLTRGGTAARTAAGAVTTPSATPTPVPSGSPITRKEAARQYLAIVEPHNKLVARCSKVAKTFEQEMTDAAFTNVKRCYREVADSNRNQSAKLRAAAWPPAVEADVEKLARFSEAQGYAFDRGATIRTHDEYWETVSPEDDGSADIVRARLGLPTREG